jgi:hypothetical protein
MIRYIFIGSFVVFIIVMIIISRKWKKNTLDTIELLPGERALFDDDCRVEMQVGPSRENFRRARVRVTNQRLIVAQRGMGKKDWFLVRYVIHHLGRSAPEGIGGGALRTGYVTYSTIPQNMSVVDDDGPCLRIEPYGDAPMGAPTRLFVRTDQIDRYRGALQVS